MSVQIITDSASDIIGGLAKEWNLHILPLKTTIGDDVYLDGIDLTHEEFYEKLIESDIMPTTSQVSPYDYEEKFREIRDSGDTAVCITLSSKLSGCYQSACIAAELFRNTVIVVDSGNASIGQHVLIEQAVRLRDQGLGAKEIADHLERTKENIRTIALMDTLEYLKKGGRVSAAAAFAGTLLSIKPVIEVVDGEVSVIGKARGSRNGNNLLNQLVEKEGGIDFSMPYCLGYSGLSDVMLQKYIRDSLHIYEGKVHELPISTIGSTIGTHAGPGAIGAAFFVNHRN